MLVDNPAFFFKRIFIELKYFILPCPKSPVFKKINGISFEFDFNLSPKVKRMYFGSYQPIISEILKKYLKNGDTFIDVGANIGYITAVGASLVGKGGWVYSFEPVPEYFQKLENFAKKNNQYKITVNQFALGDEERMGKIYIGGDIGDNTFFPDLLNGIKGVRDAEVPIRRLDKYIEENNINNIKLIKIDVEGFEFPVLKGLSDYFLKCCKAGSCPIIICEIIPSICSRLGYKLQDLFDYMKRFSYYPFEIINAKKMINIDKFFKKSLDDVLFKFNK